MEQRKSGNRNPRNGQILAKGRQLNNPQQRSLDQLKDVDKNLTEDYFQRYHETLGIETLDFLLEINSEDLESIKGKDIEKPIVKYLPVKEGLEKTEQFNSNVEQDLNRNEQINPKVVFKQKSEKFEGSAEVISDSDLVQYSPRNDEYDDDLEENEDVDEFASYEYDLDGLKNGKGKSKMGKLGKGKLGKARGRTPNRKAVKLGKAKARAKLRASLGKARSFSENGKV